MGLRRTLRTAVVLVLACTVAGVAPSYAQDERRLEIGGQVSTLRLSEFDTTDVGIGVQAGWRFNRLLAVDGALSWFPGSDDEGVARIERQHKVLGVAGVRAGVQSGPLEVFGRVRPGVLRFASEDNVACILIFPPPLACQVLGGYTAFVTEIGGGVRMALGTERRTFVSFDVGDLLVRYDREALRPGGGITEDGFLSHNLTAGIGFGWRF